MRAPTSLSSQSTLPVAEVAGFILGAPGGSVLAVGGIDDGSLRERIDQAEGAPKDRRALFMRLRPAASVEAYVEQAIELLAEMARRLWPVWFSDESFAACWTKALVDQFLKADGKFIAPTDDDLRALVALRAMAQRDLPGFDAWLRKRKPLFDAALFKEANLCPPPFLSSVPPPQPARGQRAPETESVEKTSADKTERNLAGKPAETIPEAKITPSEQKDTGRTGKQIPVQAAALRLIPIGRRYERGALGQPVTLAADLLPRHVAILGREPQAGRAHRGAAPVRSKRRQRARRPDPAAHRPAGGR